MTCEAQLIAKPHHMRIMFSMLLLHCEVADPLRLWDTYKDSMVQQYHRSGDTDAGTQQKHMQQALYHLQDLLESGNKQLSDFNLPVPPPDDSSQFAHMSRVLQQQQELCRSAAAQELPDYQQLLTPEQFAIYDSVRSALLSPHAGTQNAAFVYSPGGCGKTFVFEALRALVLSVPMRCMMA